MIGTGSCFVAAADALQAGDDFLQLHPFDQFGDGLEIAGTAAGEGYLAEPVVFDVKGDGRGANSGGLIREHNENSFLLGNGRTYAYSNPLPGFSQEVAYSVLSMRLQLK